MESEKMPTEELIRNGELSGREALEHLSQTGEFVFHGSAALVDELRPFQAINDEKIDGEPAIAATASIDTAIFRALVNKEMTQRLGLSSYRGGWSGSEEKMHYYSLKSSIEALSPEAKAYVYALALSGNEFIPHGGNEMRSLVPVTPDFTVEVNRDDLPDVDVFDSREELEEFRQSLENGPLEG